MNNQKTPLVNNEVSATLDGQSLTLNLNGTELKCSKNQALVWALCAAGFSTVEQISYQLNTLDEFDIKTSIDSYTAKTITSFADKQFLTLYDNEQVDYPIDLSSYSHICSSRGGLYALNQTGFRRIAHGMFFGLSFDINNHLLAFDFPHLLSSHWKSKFSDAKVVLDSNEGVLLKLNISEGILQSQEVGFSGLANNCHYLVRDKNQYYAVDTERQSILRVSENSNIDLIKTFDTDDYYHINALAQFKDKWLLMKSVTSKTDLTSGFGIFDHNWQLINEIQLPAERAHDFLILNESNTDQPEFWYCDSNHNQIKHYPSGDSIRVAPHIKTNNTTRGLSETEQHWVVGNGRYGRYYAHQAKPEMLGAISFINKLTHEVDHHVLVPEAPCCIIKNPWLK